ncbi:carbohydrate-binding module family 48 protein [Periconia macrospinosa]|uniref:Carbohydrate-binding module family 48 protein n=1 Tax=Periconia macrospinosa TaxID=97972 RepID=A0A2V1DL76_9PLEO|nr:carbohydrate-binding module family 48 protein [Periconia macrospinosa]
MAAGVEHVQAGGVHKQQHGDANETRRSFSLGLEAGHWLPPQPELVLVTSGQQHDKRFLAVEHAADEVYVTGQFDSWSKSVRLEKEDGIFKKTVELPKEKTLYKFVVNGEWVVNDTAPKENDDSGIVNNVLSPDQIHDTVSTLSSAAPTSTTAALAADVPKESEKSDAAPAPVEQPTPAVEDLPGAFPMTPPAATPGSEPQAFSVNPIPATEGPGNPVTLAPGEKVPEPSTLTTNTIESTVKHEPEPEPEEAKVSVAPIPATAGLGNPIQLAPGEKVPDPSTLTSNTITSTATTDATSYEKSDALPPKVDVLLTPEDERKANGGMFHLPPSIAGIIPESSLPKDAPAASEQDPGVTIQSAAPTSTTAELAGAVPKEPRAVEEPSVPETVVESQKEAGVEPEAAANPEAVIEKSEVEQELKKLVPEEPPAAEASLLDRANAAAAPAVSQATEVAQQAGVAAAAGITAAAGAFAGATYAAKDKAAEATGLAEAATTTAVTEPATASEAVPEVVAESQKEAGALPEAAANTEAVIEKKAVESELLKEVPEVKPAAESAVQPETAVKEVPAVVVESQKEAGALPEAAANPEAVSEKKAVESELLKEVTKTDEAGPAAPTVTAATSATAPGLSEDALSDSKPLKSSSEPDALNAPASKPAVPETSQPANDSRDVSPMSKPVTNVDQPIVTTGTTTTVVDTKSTPNDEPTAADSSSTPESAAADKKKKRRSFFGKIKDKFTGKS